MKNIHILPTDKPSRLFISDTDKVLELDDECIISEDWWIKNQHIYITSDEDINENDYIITKDGRLVEVSYLLSKDLQGASKIILTTDQDLIKDGVQSIDDEFLEWFVKNQSCEEVEVNLIKDSEDHPEIKGGYREEWEYYEIIIPKETLEEEPKQETTLEEAAEKYAMETYPKIEFKDYTAEMMLDYAKISTAFEFGAEYQKQQMHSEEELHNAFYNGWLYRGEEKYKFQFPQAKKEWFEQFKKL